MNPAFVNMLDFGILPLKTTTGTVCLCIRYCWQCLDIFPYQGATTGYMLGVNDRSGYSAHVCGISIRDEVLLYAKMSSKTIAEARPPFSESSLLLDIQDAKTNGKHLVFVMKYNPIDC